MLWQQVTARVSKQSTSRVEDILFAHGAVSVTFSDAEDQPQYEPLPGETKLWDITNVTGLFENSAPLETIRGALLNARLINHKTDVSMAELADQVWERAWLKDFKAMRFGQHLWICPTGFSVQTENAVVIDLDPGLAFGTGTHPTTALCLTWLDAHPPLGKTVIDYGCGSGILGIAAAKLGAQHCYAVDIDPQAIEATTSNASINQVAEQLHCYLPDQFQPIKADCLLANILAEPLIQFAPYFSTLLAHHGSITLSGILAEQADSVIAAYAPYFDLAPAQQQEDWILLTGQLKR